MVNVRQQIINSYRCGKCTKEYSLLEKAEACCSQKDWDSVDKFELKQVHLDLLKRTSISWDDCEYGAPEIDCKRPYGNSDVEDDIAEIIKLPKKDNWDFEEESWSGKAAYYMDDLHNQTKVALQIILHCQTFKLGWYKKLKDGWQKWEIIK